MEPTTDDPDDLAPAPQAGFVRVAGQVLWHVWLRPWQAFQALRETGTPAHGFALLLLAFVGSIFPKPQLMILKRPELAQYDWVIWVTMAVYMLLLATLMWQTYPYVLRTSFHWIGIKHPLPTRDLRMAVAAGYSTYLGALVFGLGAVLLHYLMTGEWVVNRSDLPIWPDLFTLINTVFAIWGLVSLNRILARLAACEDWDAFLAQVLSWTIAIVGVLVLSFLVAFVTTLLIRLLFW